MILNIFESDEQAPAKFIWRVEVTIMRGFLPCIVPKPFDSIEFRRISRKQIDLQSFTMFAKPFINFGLLVVGSIVLDQVDAMVSSIERWQQCMLKEMDI